MQLSEINSYKVMEYVGSGSVPFAVLHNRKRASDAQLPDDVRGSIMQMRHLNSAMF